MLISQSVSKGSAIKQATAAALRPRSNITSNTDVHR